VNSVLWHSALVLSVPAIRRGYRRVGPWLDRVMGGLLAAFGLKLLFGSR
jgi:threonine efflux protein